MVALIGGLGAGKTVFAKGVAEGLGLDAAVLASPTFVIANELLLPPGGPLDRLVHADFYRVERVGELEERGLYDWLARGTLLLVEWGDRFAKLLPRDRLEVSLHLEAAETRCIEGRGRGPASARLLARWETEASRAELQ